MSLQRSCQALPFSSAPIHLPLQDTLSQARVKPDCSRMNKTRGTLQANGPVGKRMAFSAIVSRVALDHYPGRRELVEDMGYYLTGSGRQLWQNHDFEIMRMADLDSVEDAVLPAIDLDRTSRGKIGFLSWAYNRLDAGSEPQVEDAAFSTMSFLLNNMLHINGNSHCLVSPGNYGNLSQPCLKFSKPVPSIAVFSEDDIAHCDSASRGTGALLKNAMVASNLFFWLNHEPALSTLGEVGLEDPILICRPRA